MSQKIQTVRGTKDLFGDDMDRFNIVVEVAKAVTSLYDFQEISTPIFEFSDVFERNLGDGSDIVMKEVYKFKDRGDNWLTLRPEFTAGIVRAFLNDGDMQQRLPLKLFSYGPVFRYDRPQKGRQRQFHQINCECFGNDSSLADVEILAMAHRILSELGLKNISLEINSLGSPEAKQKYEEALAEYFTKYKGDLSEDSRIRLEKNPLRILDSKDEGDRRLLDNVPLIKDYYSKESEEFSDGVLGGLENLGIKYKVNPLLVRGLDYYTSTVFEFTTADLGAQGTVLAGGRYDALVEKMGGRPTAAVGFGGGVERMMLLLNREIQKRRPVAVIPISEEQNIFCLGISEKLRNNNIPTELISGGKVKKKMERANAINAKIALIIGEDDIKSDKFMVKNLDSGEQEGVSSAKLLNFIKSTL